MAWYKVGDYIHDNRKKRGITQEELAFGICSPGTLSRIENNSQVPSARTCQALLERLGEGERLFSVFASADEIRSYQMSRKILRLLAGHRSDRLEELLKNYADRIEDEHPLAVQFSIYTGAIYRAARKENPAGICKELYGALRITMREELVPGNCTDKRLFTFDEILIWNNIAIQHRRLGEEQKALHVLLGLQEYMDTRMSDEEGKAGLYPVVLCNLAKWRNEMRQYLQAAEHCEHGIAICLEWGKLLPLPYLFYQRAVSLKELGKYIEAGDSFRRAAELREILNLEEEIITEEMTVGI